MKKQETIEGKLYELFPLLLLHHYHNDLVIVVVVVYHHHHLLLLVFLCSELWDWVMRDDVAVEWEVFVC